MNGVDTGQDSPVAGFCEQCHELPRSEWSFMAIRYTFKHIGVLLYRGADKSLGRPTSRCILFDGENISFAALLVIYINSNNIPPIIIINRIY